jgi:hypothetical protein
MVQFQVGKTYDCRSLCDYDCIWSYTVIGRTSSTITIRDNHTGIVVRKRIAKLSKVFDVEIVYPLGQYSMSPSISADRIRN